MDRPSPPSPPTHRVLLAEDDDELRELLLSALERAGYQVIELEDGAEFSDYLELLQGPGSLRQHPDLVLTDIRMPGASGLEVVRHARGLGLSCPVLLLSAFADGEVYSVAATLGETEVLSKPMPIDAVVARVSHWLGRSVGPSGPSGPPSAGNPVLRVLVAEDSDELRVLVSEAFRRRGWEERRGGRAQRLRRASEPEVTVAASSSRPSAPPSPQRRRGPRG